MCSKMILTVLTGPLALILNAAVVPHDSTNNWNVAEGDAAVAANYLEQNAPGANTQVRIANGGTMKVTSDLSWGSLWVGYGGRGFVEQSAGTLSLNNAGSASGDGTLWLGYNAGNVGRYELTGGTLEVMAGNNPQIGRWGLGSLAVSGGEAIFRGGYPSVGRLGSGCGHLDVSDAGVLTATAVSQFSVGESGTGALTVRGGGAANVSRLVLGANADGNGILNVCSGGVLTVAWISGGSGSMRRVNAVGGTIRAGSCQGGYLTDTEVRLGAGGLRFDTAGLDVALTTPLRTGGLSSADLAHRWSFNGDLTDSVGGQTAVLQGAQKSSIVYEDNQIRLPGASHTEAYVSLGAGIIPASCAGVTIEMWLTPMGKGTWSRIFTCNGKSRTSEGFVVLNSDCLRAKTADDAGTSSGLEAFELERKHYFVIRFARQSDNSWLLEYLKRDDRTGGLLKSHSKTVSSEYDPADFAADRFNLGWSTDSGNDDANIRFDEVRVWRRTLTDTELLTSATLGPDADFASDPAFVKTGAGQLAFAAAGSDYTGPTRVEAGQLAVAASTLPIGRWSFNGSYVNSVAAEAATPSGSGASSIVLGDEFVTLPGAAHNEAYLALGDGFWSDIADGFTFEFWVRQNEVRSWARIFTCRAGDNQYTVASRPYLFMTLVGGSGTDPTLDYVGVQGGDTAGWTVGSKMAPWTVGTWFHVAVVGRRQNDGTWQIGFRKFDVSSGACLTSYTQMAPSGWDPSQFIGGAFNLGWSHDGSNNDAAASFDEVRVWNRAFTDDELALATRLGPDALPTFGTGDAAGALPETTDLSVAANAVLALAGASQTVRTLGGNGTVQGAGTLTVTEAVRPGGAEASGTLTLAAGVKLVGPCAFETGDCLTFAAGSAYDVSGIKIRVVDPSAIVSGFPVKIASAAGATLTGAFDVSDPSMQNLKVRVTAAGDVLLSRVSGLLLLFR